MPSRLICPAWRMISAISINCSASGLLRRQTIPMVRVGAGAGNLTIDNAGNPGHANAPKTTFPLSARAGGCGSGGTGALDDSSAVAEAAAACTPPDVSAGGES